MTDPRIELLADALDDFRWHHDYFIGLAKHRLKQLDAVDPLRVFLASDNAVQALAAYLDNPATGWHEGTESWVMLEARGIVAALREAAGVGE